MCLQFANPEFLKTIVGSLESLMITILSQCRMSTHAHLNHFIDVKRILRYSKGTLNPELQLSKV